MALIEFIQGIVGSGSLVEHESKYLSYTPIVGSNNLYLSSTTRNGEVIEPAFFVHVEKEKNRVHYLPYTFSENRNELFYNVPELNKQPNIDYFTRQFPLLDIELNQSTIAYLRYDMIILD